MAVETKTISVHSEGEMNVIDITAKIDEVIRKSKINEGIATIFVPGSTASVSTIEFEPNLVKDMKNAMERLFPSDIKYNHHETWGDDNGKSHVRATTMGPSMTVPFKDKKLLLGTWQQIVLIDFDVPARKRDIVVQLMGE
ncbi:MAG: YjbQ family protein [Candidatus Aenigmarchaeota archaeon]|nr:YjbQ family protein [Candidatus Aenigmarchaeota archaeon]